MIALTGSEGYLQIAAGFFSRWLKQKKRPRGVDLSDDTRMRRDFMTEMMARNPDAFASELDVQSMMHCFPSRF